MAMKKDPRGVFGRSVGAEVFQVPLGGGGVGGIMRSATRGALHNKINRKKTIGELKTGKFANSGEPEFNQHIRAGRPVRGGMPQTDRTVRELQTGRTKRFPKVEVEKTEFFKKFGPKGR